MVGVTRTTMTSQKEFNETMYFWKTPRAQNKGFISSKRTTRKKGTCGQGFCGWPSELMAHRPVAVAGMLVEIDCAGSAARCGLWMHTSSTPRSPFR
jgi:hypothetical protein